jgi:hypothetical protein
MTVAETGCVCSMDGKGKKCNILVGKRPFEGKSHLLLVLEKQI